MMPDFYYRSVENCVFACKANERSACEQAAMPRHRKPERAIFNMPIMGTVEA
jgi:hypothetical protein